MTDTATRLRDLEHYEFHAEPNPFHTEPAAAGPMTQDEYDAIHDDIHDAYLRDHARVTEFLTESLACLGVIARGVDVDNWEASACLERMQLAAKSGVPMYEPQEGEL